MKTGISNRESAEQEARERRQHPPINPDAPAPQDASGRTGDGPIDENGRQTSRKGGSRSTAQKAAGTRQADVPMPPAKKVAGAFGEEPGAPADRNIKGTLKRKA